MNRSRIRLFRRHKCMSYLMIGYDQLLLIGKHPVFLLITSDNHLNTLLKVSLGSKLPAVTDSTKSCLVYNIGKLCTGSAGCCLGNFIETDTVCDFDLSGMDFQDFLTSFQIRKFYRNTSVKTTWTQEGRVQGIRTVGSSQDHNSLGAVKSIHLCKQLVQSLLTFIVSTCEASAVTFLTNGINLINKYNTRCLLICLFKQITNLGSTHAHKHFHKFRTGNREKRYFCFSCNCLGEQCLTCTRRSYKKGALGHGCSNLRVFLWIVKIIYNFRKKLFRLVLTCHICKFNSCRRLHIYFGIAFSKGHCSARASAHRAHHLFTQPSPKENKDYDWNHISDHQTEKDGLLLRLHCFHTGSGFIKAAYKVWIIHTYSLAHHVLAVLSDYIIDIIVLHLCLGYISTLYIAEKCTIVGLLHRAFLHGRNGKYVQEKDHPNRYQCKNVQWPVLWFFMVNIHWHFLHFLSTVKYFSISMYEYQYSASKIYKLFIISSLLYFYNVLLYQLFNRRHVGMADEADSKSVVGNYVWVQVPLPALFNIS